MAVVTMPKISGGRMDRRAVMAVPCAWSPAIARAGGGTKGEQAHIDAAALLRMIIDIFLRIRAGVSLTHQRQQTSKPDDAPANAAIFAASLEFRPGANRPLRTATAKYAAIALASAVLTGVQR